MKWLSQWRARAQRVAQSTEQRLLWKDFFGSGRYRNRHVVHATPVGAPSRQSEPTVSMFELTTEGVREHYFERPADFWAYQPAENATVWINMYGLHDVAFIQAICERYGVHSLVQEDLIHTDQRVKVEDYGNHVFIVVRLHDFLDQDDMLADQIGIILGKNFVLTFQEQYLGIFNPIRERIRQQRQLDLFIQPDYLLYHLLDILVDHYFVVLEKFSEKIERLDQTLLVEKSPANVLQKIHILKLDTLVLRRALWPLREVIGVLLRADQSFISVSTRVFLRDVHDHVTHHIEALELLRDLVSGLSDIHMANQGIRLNQEMRFLTVIATIFMPLTFIAGVYGMNFENMPELKWEYGYALVWGVMVVVGGGLAYFFWRRRWL